MDDRLKAEVFALKDEMISLRRDFHMFPELGFNERQTAGKIKEYLNALGLTVKTGVAETGVVSVIKGHGPGKTLLLRADMDALPILEKNDLPFRSKNDGVMHACGHDGHMAILLAVAKILNARKNNFSGNVKLVFQPGEEALAGAFFMIEAGVLQNPTVDAALALHLFTTFPTGHVMVREAEAMASADMFTITLNGQNGHGAFPESGIDAIFIAGHVITALQGIVSREIGAQSPAVVHIGKIQGGSATNIIADNVQLSGSVRTLNENVRCHIEERLGQITSGIVSAFRGTCSVDYLRGYPTLKNDAVLTQLVERTAVAVVGPDNVTIAEPIMGSEDMAFFLEKVPGCFFFVGAANKQKGFNRPHHNEHFNFDEEALVIGAETLARAALAYLETP
jgi:amidohydrolase